MIETLSPETVYAIHLRAPSVSGGKDWVGSVTTAGEIHTFWGKTDHVGQSATRPGTLTELKILVISKCAKGYREVDEYRPGFGWLSQIADSSPFPTSPSATHVGTSREPSSCLLGPSAESLRWDF